MGNFLRATLRWVKILRATFHQPNKRYLSNHKEKHKTSKDYPYMCNNCGKSFTLKFSLKRHEIVHTGEKPFECITCLKRFNYQNDLKRHEVVHTAGEKPFQCKNCQKSFSRSDTLRRHERNHTDEKPFACKNCEKCFSRLDKLKVHEAFHHKYGNKMISFLKNENQNT